MAYRLLILVSFFILVRPLYPLNVECQGIAQIESTQELARQTAIENSGSSCIRSALSRIYGEDIVNSNELRLKKIYEKASSFISSSHLVSEEYSPETNSYVVIVDASVNEADLKSYIAENGIAISSEKVRMVLPLIVERTSEEGEGEFWWGNRGKFAPRKEFSDVERALGTYLSQGSFVLMDPFENQAIGNIPESSRYMEMRLSDLSELGRLFGAGLVASGYIWTSCRKENRAGKTKCETTLSIQMISTETSKIRAAKRATYEWTADKSDEARTVSRARACKEVAESLVYQLSQKWDKGSSSNFKIAIKGIKNYTQYSQIKKCILGSQIPGLYGVVERYQVRGLFVFEGDRRSDTGIVQEALSSRCFYNMDSELKVVEPNKIEVKI